MALCKRHGLEIRWFERKPVLARDKDAEVRSMVRSFFEPPGTIYLNKALQTDPARLKFDLASHIGHKVLHGGDGLKSPHATGGEIGESPDSGSAVSRGHRSEGRAARVAGLRMQLLRRRAALSESAVPPLPDARALPDRREAQARAHRVGDDAADDEGLAVSVLAFLRRRMRRGTSSPCIAATAFRCRGAT